MMSINEARALENLNPREGADELLVDKQFGAVAAGAHGGR